VNNVGLARHEAFGAVDPEVFAAVMDFNVRPAPQLTQALLSGMRAARFGWIINVTALSRAASPFAQVTLRQKLRSKASREQWRSSLRLMALQPTPLRQVQLKLSYFDSIIPKVVRARRAI
jgi:NAD(P)-dependent dehydrogenase (short-subunit alcohol dehydrogenase family)